MKATRTVPSDRPDVPVGGASVPAQVLTRGPPVAGGRKAWAASLAVTVASAAALDACATAAGVLLVASGLLDGVGHAWALALLVASYAVWAAGLRTNLRANGALLAATGASTNVLSKAAHDLTRRMTGSARAPRLAAAIGYVGTEVAKELPYYAGAFGTAVLSDSITSNEALMFLTGTNLGAGLYEYGVARLTAAFLRRRSARKTTGPSGAHRLAVRRSSVEVGVAAAGVGGDDLASVVDSRRLGVPVKALIGEVIDDPAGPGDRHVEARELTEAQTTVLTHLAAKQLHLRLKTLTAVRAERELRAEAEKRATAAANLAMPLRAATEQHRTAPNPQTCQLGGVTTACTAAAELKIADSWGDSAWGCTDHVEEAIINLRSVFIASEELGGLAAYLHRR